MQKSRRGPRSWVHWVTAACLVACSALVPARADAQQEPISATGHGGFFDEKGRQIPVTLAFAQRTQRWYRDRLLAGLPAARQREFLVYEKQLHAGLRTAGQERMLLQHEAIEWLLEAMPQDQTKLQAAAKLRALRHAMNLVLPARGDLRIADKREAFVPRPELRERLESQQLKRSGSAVTRSATVNSGQAYIDECRAAGVPIPPTINVLDPAGTAGWKSQGFIPPAAQFIVGTPAEVRTYKSSSPEGMCYALPRYADSTLGTATLDGVICMGKQSSKVCFWDNQRTVGGVVQAFNIAAGEQVPIGVPSVPGGKYQGGGKEIEFGPGGVCTNCHAGENPYIIHPKANLATSGPAVLWESLALPPQSLPSMSINRYDPLVGSTWPQNNLSQAQSTVPAQCVGCHVKGAAGRFPHLSNQLASYCSTVLAQGITRTMPPGAPGSAAAAANAFKDMWCGFPPNAGSADAGDPHITTINGVNYDFQAAGEFTALKNEDTGFELQTRHSPVLTNFTPQANPYTGLASCVSVNSAVALRVGKQRITFQGINGAFAGREDLQLRLDGKLVDAAQGIQLEGGVVGRTKDGELEVKLADGTRVVVIPLFWTSQGVWYLDVQVLDTPAREGVMGPVLTGEWLPRAPDGATFGAKPVALMDRHKVLNLQFADAWRVSGTSSLFDYAPGTSTSDFTDRDWPAAPGKPCTQSSVRGVPLVKEPRPDLAKQACSNIKNKNIRANCMFDVTVMGDAVAAKGHLRAVRLRAGQ